MEPAEHSILSRIEDTARFVASVVISNMAFGTGGTARYSREEREEWRRRTREFAIPQEADRLLAAHSTLESGIKYLIKRTGRSYTYTHDLGTLLQELMGCDPMAARSLCDAFDAAIKFYGTDTQDPDYRHLASLPDYLRKAATEDQFKLLRYFEVESWIDDPALGYMYVEFHYEILRALGEVLLPRYGAIFERVEKAARRAFLDRRRLDSLASHSEASKEAYTRWLEDQGTYLGALRKLGSRERPIGDDHADRVATSVCYNLTGSEEVALRIMAHAQVSSEPIQQRDVETCIWRIKGSMNRIVTTPANDPIGFTRPLHTGFWVASDDISDTRPSWFRTELDARLYLANLFLIKLFITTERGSWSHRVVSKKSSRGTRRHPSLELEWCNWAEFGTNTLWLKLWDSHHGLLPGDHIEVSTDVDENDRDPVSELYWRGRVTHVAGQDVYATDASRLFRPLGPAG